MPQVRVRARQHKGHSGPIAPVLAHRGKQHARVGIAAVGDACQVADNSLGIFGQGQEHRSAQIRDDIFERPDPRHDRHFTAAS
jgi:hypothetical protein